MLLLPRLLALVILAVLPAPMALADELDQVSVLGDGQVGSISVNQSFSRAQTFTVGRTGVLTRVRLVLGKADTMPGDALRFDVRPTTGGGAPVAADASALGSVVVPEDAIPQSPGLGPNFDVDFSGQGIHVVEGELLAIVARSDVPFDSNRTFAIIASVGSPYAGGEAWFGFPDWVLQDVSGPGTDWLFETYVQVPEPDGALGAALAALAGLAGKRRASTGRIRTARGR